MTNFEQLTEEQKINKALHYAFMHCQAFLINHHHDKISELDDYKKELIALIEWIRPKLDLEGFPLY